MKVMIRLVYFSEIDSKYIIMLTANIYNWINYCRVSSM